MTQSIDRDGRATVASAEAQAALGAGDTGRAHEMFAQAGDILEREMRAVKDDETEHLLRFLSATQFFKGGHYRRALELARKIKTAKLPASTRSLLPKFMQDVKDRASSDYADRVGEQLQALWTAQDYAGVIEILQRHPYTTSPADLAFIRAVCCEMLGKYRPAVLFFADAARRSQNNPAVIAALAPLPLNLPAQGRLQEAWEYARAQLELFPNAVSYAVSSLLCYHRARHAEEDARASLLKEQGQYFDLAREEFAGLPAAHQNHPVIKEVMGMGYEAVAYALYRSGDEKAGLEMCEAAIAFDPASPNAWTLLGVLRSGRVEAAAPNTDAAAAFKRAIELGDQTYFPYYYLSYDALKKGDFREALDWSLQALERGERQEAQVKSLLHQWAGISLAQLGGPRAEIEAHFKTAVEIAPDSEYARRNYRHFQTSGLPQPSSFAPPIAKRPHQAEDIVTHVRNLFHSQRFLTPFPPRLAG